MVRQEPGVCGTRVQVRPVSRTLVGSLSYLSPRPKSSLSHCAFRPSTLCEGIIPCRIDAYLPRVSGNHSAGSVFQRSGAGSNPIPKLLRRFSEVPNSAQIVFVFTSFHLRSAGSDWYPLGDGGVLQSRKPSASPSAESGWSPFSWMQFCHHAVATDQLESKRLNGRPKT